VVFFLGDFLARGLSEHIHLGLAGDVVDGVVAHAQGEAVLLARGRVEGTAAVREAVQVVVLVAVAGGTAHLARAVVGGPVGQVGDVAHLVVAVGQIHERVAVALAYREVAQAAVVGIVAVAADGVVAVQHVGALAELVVVQALYVGVVVTALAALDCVHLAADVVVVGQHLAVRVHQLLQAVPGVVAVLCGVLLARACAPLQVAGALGEFAQRAVLAGRSTTKLLKSQEAEHSPAKHDQKLDLSRFSA